MERITTNDGTTELVRNWATDLDGAARAQALRAAGSPAVTEPLALMPDAHLGAGATIGSVLATDAVTGGLIPSAVGVDLGCGMTALKTNLADDELPDDLRPLLDAWATDIPAGVGQAHSRTGRAANRWLEANPLPRGSEIESRDHERAHTQLGTLGSGNHFVEGSVNAAGEVWIVLHSGSRGIGNKLAQHHIRAAKELAKAEGRILEDPDLAYFLATDPQFEAYRADMLWAQDYALANRDLMMDAALGALRALVPHVAEVDRIRCHHNYAERETHDGRDLWVTRKGAIRARAGDRGVIPGSMGTSTMIVEGLGSHESYCSASHGAGRKLSRTKARKQLDAADFARQMQGRTWQQENATKLLDEAPDAYKDIHDVMADQEDLVRVTDELTAIVNYKGL